ncbi:thiamine/thiamine pyrophosphate ABC transporter permease ThiP [Pseudooceanicola sp.]|uniref:thiamine/thiamine pyrophosphate ABC transporter permease ThiP n=1 Tax=Pseudooceanicola sp. TaxID=1914328 RepID=UPI002614C32F|nr:thiamine/thiamine pyrophosphate ABC transporter permease ThiP [Pseudooceanicola sp.]MDF1855402.1 thiamine/thiamine pyrophosphate ABC transporter permease ThiP [Pseudooceanicola sp.]
MAPRPVALNRGAMIRGWPGRSAALALAAFLLAPLIAILWRAGGFGSLSTADWPALRFTLLQAVLSALCSAALAVPVARALARRRFGLRGAYIALMGAPFILPVIVAVIGFIAVFGRAGLLNSGLALIGVAPVSIYGLHGVVLAHVFFNLPLSVRLILQGWQAIPAERFRLVALLGADSASAQRLLEWPMLRQVLPGVIAVVFAICLTSFAVALTLGGGPRATTIELAIYQAFRFDFDLGRAASLSLVQFALVTLAGLAALKFGTLGGPGAGFDRPVARWDLTGRGLRLADALWLGLAALFLLGPLAAVIARGLTGLTHLGAAVWQAAMVSLALALAATGLTLILALTIATARRGWVELVGMAPLAASPLVLGTGLFLLIHPLARPADWALVVTLTVNAAMALPFALRILTPVIAGIETDYGRLADQLNLQGWTRLRWLILPRARPALGFAAGLTAALSMGDLGVITLFADPERATLPLMVWRLMGAYQMQAAAGAALLLLILSFALFALFDLGGRRHADP